MLTDWKLIFCSLQGCNSRLHDTCCGSAAQYLIYSPVSCVCSYEDLKLEFSCLSCRHLLHHCFQALMDHGVKVASVLANSFSRRCSYIAESDAHVKEKAIQFGFVLGNSKNTGQTYRHSVMWKVKSGWMMHGPNSLSCPLGGFLSDAGWYGDAEKVFLSCLQLCTLHDEVLHWYRAVECCVRWDLFC